MNFTTAFHLERRRITELIQNVKGHVKASPSKHLFDQDPPTCLEGVRKDGGFRGAEETTHYR